MLVLLLKVRITAVLVVALSELGRRSSFAGAPLAWRPLTSLASFLAFPPAVKAGWGFWPAVLGGSVATLCVHGGLPGMDRLFQLGLFG